MRKLDKREDDGDTGLFCYGGIHGGAGSSPRGRHRGRQSGIGPTPKTVYTISGVRVVEYGKMGSVKRRGPNPLLERVS